MEDLVYVAAPYNDPNPDVVNERMKRLTKQVAQMMSSGMHVFCPNIYLHPIAQIGELSTRWEYWESYCRAVLGRCQKMIVLMFEDWKLSTGVEFEIKIAEEEGIPVEYVMPTVGFEDEDDEPFNEFKLPDWEELKMRKERGEVLCPIDEFVYSNEPAAPEEAKAWRGEMSQVLDAAYMLGLQVGLKR